MSKGPIVIVDDDKDDQELYAEAIVETGIANEIKFFNDAPKALDYLSNTTEQPFLILSDINMVVMNGFEFKEAIQRDEHLKTKSIPFVFISTNASSEVVRKAHLLSVQGFFKKPADYEGIKNMMQTLFDYWRLCRHINNSSRPSGC